MLRNESCIWKKKCKSLPFPHFSKLPYRFFFFWTVTFTLEINFLFSLTEFLLLADFWKSGTVPLIPGGMDSSAGQRWGAESSHKMNTLILFHNSYCGCFCYLDGTIWYTCAHVQKNQIFFLCGSWISACTTLYHTAFTGAKEKSVLQGGKEKIQHSPSY